MSKAVIATVAINMIESSVDWFDVAKIIVSVPATDAMTNQSHTIPFRMLLDIISQTKNIMNPKNNA